MKRRPLSPTILGCVAPLVLAAGCGDSTPAPTEEQKNPNYAAESVAKLKMETANLKTPKAQGPMGPADMMKGVAPPKK